VLATSVHARDWRAAGTARRRLSVGEAQRVEILKTLYRGAKILILDEPTAVLSPPEVRELWQVLRSLQAQAARSCSSRTSSTK
jgi:simple sugar transport system ATP-binding protein